MTGNRCHGPHCQVKKDIIEGVANTIRLTNPKTGIRMSEIGGHPIIQALKTKHAETWIVYKKF